MQNLFTDIKDLNQLIILMAEGTTTTNVRKGTIILVGFYTRRGTSRLDQCMSRTPACAFLTFSGHFYIYILPVDMKCFQWIGENCI